MFKYAPVVFAVGNEYQIMMQITCESLFRVQIGEKMYFDETNGIMNSISPVHRVSVPMAELDEAGEYTICIQPILERKPYFTECKETQFFKYSFRPVPKNNIRLYHIADAHNHIEQPVRAARTFGEIDLLILNGDIIDHSGNPDKFSNIYEMCSLLTEGRIPVVFSRGNHDMRGNFAEKFADYTPSLNRKTYYTFRLGCVWGLVLDCGEDKCDSHEEYGNTVACHCFRQRQTEYIKSIIKDADNEYAADGVESKLVIVHNPFTMPSSNPIFRIETDIYSEWSKLLREHIKPDMMLCGHTHAHGIFFKDNWQSNLEQPCPIVVGAEPQKDLFIGCGIVINNHKLTVTFTDSDGNTLSNTDL